MWHSDPPSIEILETKINNLRHMVDSSRKSLREEAKKQQKWRKEECSQIVIYLFALLPERAGIGIAVGNLLEEALR